MLLTACGEDDGNNRRDLLPQSQDQTEGVYRAILLPANPLIDNNVSGSVVVSQLGDNFSVNVDLDNGPEGSHAQHIHLGSSCASIENDVNGDGYLDANEASSVVGEVLLPLDNDLARVEEATYPTGASYDYAQSTSFALLTSAKPEVQNLEGKVVEIHGVPATQILRETVASPAGRSAQESIPIACGILVRVQAGNDPDTIPNI